MFKAHPRRWSPAYKCFVLFCVIAIGWQANYAAAISSVTTESMSEQFGVGTEVAQLSTALFFVGVGQSSQILTTISLLTHTSVSLHLGQYQLRLYQKHLDGITVRSLFVVHFLVETNIGALLSVRFHPAHS